MFLHPLPVQRQHRDALRVSRQRAADVPKTIKPLQQLKDLNTQDRRSAMSEEKTARQSLNYIRTQNLRTYIFFMTLE